MAKFTVKYKITGFEGSEPNGEFVDTSGPYKTWDLAEQHQQDIRGFEGCEYAYVYALPAE